MGRAKKAAVPREGISEDLSRLKADFDHWRATRTVGKRIPAQLWSAAIDMAAQFGVPVVADVLHLDGEALVRRLVHADGAPAGDGPQPLAQEPSALKFVEMIAPTMPPPPTPITEAARAECVVELVNARGTTMRVEFRGAGMAGLAVLCNVFCAAA